MTEELHGKVIEPTPDPSIRETISLALEHFTRKEKRTPVILAFRRAIGRK